MVYLAYTLTTHGLYNDLKIEFLMRCIYSTFTPKSTMYMLTIRLIALWRLTSKVPTVLYIAHLVPHLVLYFPDVVHSTRKQCTCLRFSEKHQVLHSSSPSLATSINSNYYKPFKAECPRVIILSVLYPHIHGNTKVCN